MIHVNLANTYRISTALIVVSWASTGAFAQPDIPAVTREYSLFVGDLRANYSSPAVSYFGGSLQGDTVSRPFTYFGGSLQSDVWWKEVSVDVGSCMEPQQPPIILTDPQPASICLNGTAQFAVSATGDGRVVYQWQAEAFEIGSGTWIDLPENAPFPGEFVTIATIEGSSMPVLSIHLIDPGVTTRFRAIVSNACGSVTSMSATLTICRGDFNCSGGLNSQDFFDFLAAFFAGDARADFNHDTVINSQDFFDFLAVFFAGC